MVLLSVLQEMGLRAKTGVDWVMVGLLDTESMANALFVVVKTGGGYFFLITALPFNLDPSIGNSLPLIILRPCTLPFAL
jgi:hypothetical protein